MTLALGPFELDAPIAQGGMGQVWRGAHRGAGIPVAVKVLTGQITQQPRFRDAFRNEARAMSGLDHPGIVRIYDYGDIPAGGEAEAHFGRSCPYLVMEYVENALHQGLRISSWATLQGALLALLEALAHAHARGVVHRDLKPSNILVTSDGRLKLTDFGIAFALEAEGVDVEQLRAAGTPEFMAPEQCHGLWRDFGPWTDLYALGCLAFALATGEPPWQGDTPMGTMLAKLEEDIPPLDARFAVPDGFEAWVRRLLQRAPGHRFQRAADAIWALRGVSFEERRAPWSSIPPEVAPPIRTGDTQGWFSEDTLVTGGFDALPGSGAPATYSLEPNVEGTSTASLRATRAPIPVDWRGPERPRETPDMFDVGLGLYGLRRTPLVDREEICDLLWKQLRLVHTIAEPRIVLLRGPAGAGKSRIAEWLGERAHEMGAAMYLHARHAPDPGPAHGLSAMLLRHLRCTGLNRSGVRDRVRSLLSAQGVEEADEWDALTELIAPADVLRPDAGERHIRFTSLIERHLVLMRHLDRLAYDRALVLWLDDVQWAYESLEFVCRLVERGDGAFVVVMTVREEELADRPIEARLIGELLEQPEVEVADVGPLSPEHHRILVRGLLALEPGLAHQVEARTAGNPHFAIQLVRDWVQRGLLEAGPRGFRLAAGANVDLPADIGEVWSQRIEQLLAERPESDAIAMELAAVLGQEVDEREWQALCRLARAAITEDLRGMLLRERLIRPLDEQDPEEGWTFAHAMLREALERHSDAAGRLKAQHLLAAGMLRARGVRGARLGRHLRAGGAFYAALEPLRASVEGHLAAGDYRAAEAALIDWMDTLDELDIPEVDRRWAEGHLLISRIASLRGDFDEAESQAIAAEEEARSFGWHDLEIGALVQRCRIALEQGRYLEGRDLAEVAQQIADEGADLDLQAEVAWHRGRLEGALGHFEVAIQALRDAETAFRAVGDPVKAAHCMLSQARLALTRTAPRDALALVEAARDELHAAGSRTGVADAVHDLGEMSRIVGDLASAEEYYREARSMYDILGSANVVFAEINLTTVLIARRAFIEARLLLQKVLESAISQGRQALVAGARVLYLPICAHDRDWRAWDEHLREARDLLRKTAIVEPDVARHAQLAAEMAAAAQQPARATQAMRLAQEQWKAMGMEAEAEEAARQARAYQRQQTGYPSER